MDSNFSFIGASPAAFPGGGGGGSGDGRSNINVNHTTLDPTDPAPAIHVPNNYDDGILVQHAPAIHNPNKFDDGNSQNDSYIMSQQSDIVFNTNALGGSPRGKVLRINSQDEVHDPSSVASVTSDRTRRSSTRYKEEDGDMEDGDMEDTHQHGQTKPPVRKKGKTGSSDNRWSKRFTWPDALHRDFVSAIFDVGLKHASPSTIVEFMTPDLEITSERVKSHLQKYRMNRQKSRAEFMESYDACLDEYQNGHSQYHDKMLRQAPPKACGMTAAYLTHKAILNDSSVVSQTSQHPRSLMMDASSNLDRAGVLPLPLLTTDEKDGPIGQGFGYLVGLHQALSQQLDETRKRHQDMSSLNEQSRPQAHLQPVVLLRHNSGMGGSRDASIASDPSGHEIVIPNGGASSNNSYMMESQMGYAGMYSQQQPTPYHYQHYQGGGSDAHHQYANRPHSSSLSSSSHLSNSQHSMPSPMMPSPVTGMTPMMTNLNVYTGAANSGTNPPTIMLNDRSQQQHQQQQNNRNMYCHEPPIQPRQDPRRRPQESNIYL